MFGKKIRLNPLASRKHLLIAESELNRAQLVEEWHTLADGVRSLADRGRTMGCLAAATASLVAGLASFRRNQAAVADGKPSWWRTLLKGAHLAGSFWSEIRSRPKS